MVLSTSIQFVISFWPHLNGFAGNCWFTLTVSSVVLYLICMFACIVSTATVKKNHHYLCLNYALEKFEPHYDLILFIKIIDKEHILFDVKCVWEVRMFSYQKFFYLCCDLFLLWYLFSKVIDLSFCAAMTLFGLFSRLSTIWFNCLILTPRIVSCWVHRVPLMYQNCMRHILSCTLITNSHYIFYWLFANHCCWRKYGMAFRVILLRLMA